MKHLSAYKSLCTLILVIILANVCEAQHTAWTEKTAKAWLKEKVWANGLKLTVHEPLNVVEFAKQYEANKANWDKVIDFLRDRNLEMIEPGKYPIAGEDVFAIITEPAAKELDSAGFERHRNYIDLHYVIKGEEKIYAQGMDTITMSKPYDATKDVENFALKGKAYTATPRYFFLFFPGELHEPGIRPAGAAKEKKLVIKIRAVK
jgi:biofilm protein TabA